jgi:2-dehydro-3-deoxyphosphooctonate aldolase (KDO 8-P synthase)
MINQPLALIAGPCAIENMEHSLLMAGRIKNICDKHNIQYIFKSSFDKDCRSSLISYRGVGLKHGLSILKKVKHIFDVPVTSDVAHVPHIDKMKHVVDLIQIPAYLSRQTRLLFAAGDTGLPINIKKGQFLSPQNMLNAANKVRCRGNMNVLLTDRGTFFGYGNLVNDMRCFQVMKQSGFPTCYDATHSIQLPASLGTHSGGQRDFIPSLTCAAIAAGANSLFMEVHDTPCMALCDSQTQLPIGDLEPIIIKAKEIYELRRRW